MMDQVRTAGDRAADERLRGRDRGRGRERADSRDRADRREGRVEDGDQVRARRETDHREVYDKHEDRYTRTQLRPTRQRADVVEEGWDEPQYRQPERYGGQRRRRDVEQYREVRRLVSDVPLQ